MDNENYNATVNWAAQKGLRIYKNMEHKCVDGIWGMYATSDIPKNTVLVCYPVKNVLPFATGFEYPKNCEDILKRVHAATIEYSLGESSEWWGLMRSVESLQELQSTNAYFLDAQELKTLQAMNPLLHRIVEERKKIIDEQVEALYKIDPSLDRNRALVIALNFKTRSWGEGFLPIFDQFNTSEAYGAKVCKSEENIYFMSMVDYRAGEQIWISYGQRDLYDYAIDYDFFDENATHAICFSTRGSQFTQNDFETAVIRYAATKHKVEVTKTETGLQHQLMEEDAKFLEHAPSARLIEYIQHTAFRTRKEFKTKKCLPRSFDIRLNQILDALLSVNKVDEFQIENIPQKLHRFYHLLKKEKEILLNNKQWAKFNSIHVNEIDPTVRDSVNL